MIQNQIRTNRVTDPLIIAAMSELPRERFVPDALQGIAYVDEDVPLGRGRYLIEPLVTALLLQAAEIDADDVARDVGCGTGYCSAIIAGLASTVVALESHPDLAALAAGTFAELGLNTASVVLGPLREGWPAQTPYDVIAFGGAVSTVPPAITETARGGRTHPRSPNITSMRDLRKP
jgi:protein-L-isoaspartate(D-aspartate) O-methyltransferase